MAAGNNMGRVGAREIVAVDEGERACHGHSMRMLRGDDAPDLERLGRRKRECPLIRI
jgi:hypothetical protein